MGTFKVALSAGHGAKNDQGVIDPGAVNPLSKLEEAVITKKIIDAVAKKLGEEKISYSIMKRNWDLSLTAAEANNYIGSANGIFIEVHCNAATTADAKGYETYSYPGSTEGAKLASNIQNNIINYVKGFYDVSVRNGIDRGTKTASFQVIRETDCPAVLIECGFITNSYESKLMDKPNYIEAVANGIIAGIKAYEGVKPPQTAVVTPTTPTPSVPSNNNESSIALVTLNDSLQIAKVDMSKIVKLVPNGNMLEIYVKK